ncbi:hypothetical protein KIH74_28210 [Kineosporia sp. J2-2]|uniref:Uncharacterized protein n=1 Tax=Kineosporia corallincola TaxID=2835133 RepID=A0ABS5TQQ3_9ACTN|nr:hypothetical protein [Kineosporia corallincola]MBT0772859.1 hypothetical protein [Kineosporia corallincola]
MREVEHGEGGRWFKTSVVDEEAIDHERMIGAVRVVGTVVRVRVAQRTDFDLLADPVVIRPSPPRITLGESFEMNAVQALELAEHLQTAARFAREAEEASRRRPRLVFEA